jgi:hypothetical protein
MANGSDVSANVALRLKWRLMCETLRLPSAVLGFRVTGSPSRTQQAEGKAFG